LFFVISPGNIRLEKINITAPEAVTVETVSFTRGTHLKKGQMLFTIKINSQPERLTLLKAEREVLAEAYSTKTDTTNLKRLLTLAKGEVQYHRKILEDTKELFNKGAATKAELNLAESKLASETVSLIRLQGELKKLAEESIPTQYKVRLKEIDEEIRLLESKQKPITINSPDDGVITDIYVSPKQVIEKGSMLAILASTESIKMVAYVDPADLHFVSKDSPVTIRFPGGKIIKAKVKTYPGMVQPMSGTLTTPFSNNQIALRVELEPIEPIPQDFLVDGLPFSVHWGFHLKLWEYLKLWE
jgi:Multidrug resistance efflux pump